MTTAATQLPSARPFTPEECAVLVAAGIITDGEQAAVLAGKRRFTVDEYLAMIEAGILRKEERLELIDGGIIIMSPIGEYHELAPAHYGACSGSQGRATVRIQGSIRLNDRNRPEPDVAVLRRRPANEMGPYFPSDVYFLIEVADSSLQRDSGPKLARYAAAGIPGSMDCQPASAGSNCPCQPVRFGYTTVRTYRPGESISPEAFPDVSLAVDDFMPPAPGPDVEIA